MIPGPAGPAPGPGPGPGQMQRRLGSEAEVGRGTRHEVIIDFVKCTCMCIAHVIVHVTSEQILLKVIE